MRLVKRDPLGLLDIVEELPVPVDVVMEELSTLADWVEETVIDKLGSNLTGEDPVLVNSVDGLVIDELRLVLVLKEIDLAEEPGSIGRMEELDIVEKSVIDDLIEEIVIDELMSDLVVRGSDFVEDPVPVIIVEELNSVEDLVSVNVIELVIDELELDFVVEDPESID